MKKLRTLKHLLFGTYARIFVFSYLLFMVVGALLLKLPLSVQAEVSLDWVDAFFVSASGLSTTGLTPVVPRETFTIFGQVVLALIIQFGGIGIIMMISIFWLAIRKKIGFRERGIMMTDQNQLSRHGIVRFVRNVLIVIFTIEAIAFVIMSAYLYLSGHFPLSDALFQAFFLTISLFTNAGFDIAPDADSFAMFSQDYFMQTLAMTLMFIGAAGFWVLAEIKEFIHAKLNRQHFHFSVFVKLLVALHLSIWIVSALLLLLVEQGAFFSGKGLFETLYYSLFMSLTTRNAGFSTMDVAQFTTAVHVFFVGLMFLGSSPNSAGGGIRTTTLLTTFLGSRSFALGRNQVVYHGRTIPHETVFKSFIVLFGAITLIAFNVFVLSVVESMDFKMLLFEATSAFGTTGLSLGATPELHSVSKILLIFTMFIGRVGILAFLLMFKPERQKKGYVTYPEMDIIVG